ncbi:hypothetical protein A6V39_00400 [Candidatus Mycoplasma haematobovis]|uniref:Uncharacterized protein n=1 Tax=Candidatus Mycoplasma haematobovis TaxID=432608 RepID=A0A1A9QFN6_9MOLU|nr:hypothetical protein [Candidatus Mycoplasma haematobovis]OAL10510.1 hypothetical protein A6V39_00400 [Candidatus Mycoplasma haematobovis]
MTAKFIVSAVAGTTVLGGGIATGTYYLMKSNENNKDTKVNVVAKTLLQELTGADFEALNTDPANSEHDTEWGKLVEKHLKQDFTAVPKIANINIVAGTPPTNNTANIKALKAECKKMFEKTINFETDKVTARNWCNKKSKILATQD